MFNRIGGLLVVILALQGPQLSPAASITFYSLKDGVVDHDRPCFVRLLKGQKAGTAYLYSETLKLLISEDHALDETIEARYLREDSFTAAVAEVVTFRAAYRVVDKGAGGKPENWRKLVLDFLPSLRVNPLLKEAWKYSNDALAALGSPAGEGENYRLYWSAIDNYVAGPGDFPEARNPKHWKGLAQFLRHRKIEKYVDAYIKNQQRYDEFFVRDDRVLEVIYLDNPDISWLYFWRVRRTASAITRVWDQHKGRVSLYIGLDDMHILTPLVEATSKILPDVPVHVEEGNYLQSYRAGELVASP